MNATENLVCTACPVCSGTLAVPFFDGGLQTLATLGWPTTAAEAKAMDRFPLNFVQCPACSHVWNRSFRYDAIPYQKNPNRMFNLGGSWKGYLAGTLEGILINLPENPTVIEIGCGEGHFIRGLARAWGGNGRFVGFDPNASAEAGCNVEFYDRLYEPLTDMPRFSPDALVVRHVLEHLTDPGAFLEQLAWGATNLNKACWLFAEVPCIDRVFDTDRLVDFFFEHASHFTTPSFRTLMCRAGEVVELAHGYGGEVVYARVKLGVGEMVQQRATAAGAFSRRAERSRHTIRSQLDELAASGLEVAIWGGTGKAAAFIHQFGADAGRFPLVVDSDPGKVGSFVPGSGQKIEYRDFLKGHTLDVLIIPTQWRSRDIVAEMEREGIRANQILIEHDGKLMDFYAGLHPYV